MSYTVLLFVHSWWRWVVLVTLAMAVALGGWRWARRAPWTIASKRAALLAMLALDLQLVLGLLLYLGVSPFTRLAMEDVSSAVKDPHLRFWLFEHGPTMIVAIALAHVGNVRIRGASDAATKHRRLTIHLALALALVLVAVPWPGRVTGRPLWR